MSLNKSRFGNTLNLIYSNELEVKNTNDAQNSASDLDLRIEIDNDGRLKAKIDDKRDDMTSLFQVITYWLTATRHLFLKLQYIFCLH